MKRINKFSIQALILLICLFFFREASSQTLKAVNDTIILYPGIPKTVNLFANDTVPLGDSLKVSINILYYIPITDTNNFKGFFTFLAKTWGYNSNISGEYTIHDYTINNNSTAKLVFKIRDHSYDSLDINNVKAAITAYGNQFFLPGSEISLFRIPANGLKGTMSNFSLWIGGKGVDSTLYFAGEMYKQGSIVTSPYWSDFPDFYAGPVMDSVNYSIYQDTLWSRTWKVTKEEIEYHKTHWNSQGYIAPPNIVTWPGNGNTFLGQASELAPFYDRNGDGIYNAADGDYPLIPGDEAIYVIYNDDRDIHKDSGGKKMKVEVHMMAYAFNLPNDSAFKNTIFLNFKIFNRSSRIYYDTYLGAWSDFDIGYYGDDYIGCDVKRSSFFGFNGKPIDGMGQTYAYGAHPPAQSVTILGGPFMDPAGHDRPRLDHEGHQLCNESINGTGFGDSVPNNERYGLTNNLAFWNGDLLTTFNSGPKNATEYYQSMQSIWNDTTHLLYGGQGHTGLGGYGPDCRFMFPGESDSLNWGPGCQAPNGTVNWTEYTAGIAPGDIRGLGGMGPFTFQPGDVQQLDVALIFARDYSGQDTISPSVAKLDQMIDIVRNSFSTGLLPNGTSFFGIDNQPAISSDALKIYPNPAKKEITIETALIPMQGMLYIVNLNSEVVLTRQITQSRTQIDIGNLASGVYFVRIVSNKTVEIGKFIKL